MYILDLGAICDVWFALGYVWSTDWVVWFLGRHPQGGAVLVRLSSKASRDPWVSGVASVSYFEHVLTRVDLVTQPVAYLVFGQYVTCCFIIYVLL